MFEISSCDQILYRGICGKLVYETKEQISSCEEFKIKKKGGLVVSLTRGSWTLFCKELQSHAGAQIYRYRHDICRRHYSFTSFEMYSCNEGYPLGGGGGSVSCLA